MAGKGTDPSSSSTTTGPSGGGIVKTIFGDIFKIEQQKTFTEGITGRIKPAIDLESFWDQDSVMKPLKLMQSKINLFGESSAYGSAISGARKATMQLYAECAGIFQDNYIERLNKGYSSKNAKKTALDIANMMVEKKMELIRDSYPDVFLDDMMKRAESQTGIHLK